MAYKKADVRISSRLLEHVLSVLVSIYRSEETTLLCVLPEI